MSGYIENPKTKGSGILACIPQTDRCQNNCPDCFFQSGRSYLEPLDDNLPNMPDPEEVRGRVVRVNDGNDSDNNREWVLERTADYPTRFYNTASPRDLAGYGAPVVLTVNPGGMTDWTFHVVDPCPPNLMFVRVRANAWNLGKVADPAVAYYASRKVPVVLTFMAYFSESVPKEYRRDYVYRKRTMNPYWAITTNAWRRVMDRYFPSPWVHSCGKVEGEFGDTKCRFCGNCLREYFATMERMREDMK